MKKLFLLLFAITVSIVPISSWSEDKGYWCRVCKGAKDMGTEDSLEDSEKDINVSGTDDLEVVSDNSVEEKMPGVIDELGYRGVCKNGVCVSGKHSNFIVNNGNGTAEDYLSITLKIQDKVKEKYGIKLVMEVEKFNC